MARLPYPDETTSAELEALANAVRAERGGRLLNIHRMLLHSPPVCEGFLKFFTAVRQRCLLTGRYRELAILRVGLINGARYEYDVHVPFALSEGVSLEQLEALGDWEHATVFLAADRAVLAYADAMTREVRVADHVFDALRSHFNDREILELTATIAGYNLVSRFLEALEIDPETQNTTRESGDPRQAGSPARSLTASTEDA